MNREGEKSAQIFFEFLGMAFLRNRSLRTSISPSRGANKKLVEQSGEACAGAKRKFANGVYRIFSHQSDRAVGEAGEAGEAKWEITSRRPEGNSSSVDSIRTISSFVLTG
ncbi:MAG: hypothetical protein ACI97A_002375 [Planctomycetota bacterium]